MEAEIKQAEAGQSNNESANAGDAQAGADGQQKAGEQGEVKPEAGQQAQGEKKEGDAQKTAEKAPEKYESFKMPEGMDINADLLGKFNELAKGYNLTQEKAQGLVDMAGQLVADVQKKQAEQWDKIRDEWVKEIKEDKEFGGAKFNETLERANRTVRTFFSPTFIKFIQETGYGDNPELIKGLAKIDRQLSEDKMVDGQPSGTQEVGAKTLYPNMK